MTVPVIRNRLPAPWWASRNSRRSLSHRALTGRSSGGLRSTLGSRLVSQELFDGSVVRDHSPELGGRLGLLSKHTFVVSPAAFAVVDVPAIGLFDKAVPLVLVCPDAKDGVGHAELLES